MEEEQGKRKRAKLDPLNMYADQSPHNKSRPEKVVKKKKPAAAKSARKKQSSISSATGASSYVSRYISVCVSTVSRFVYTESETDISALEPLNIALMSNIYHDVVQVCGLASVSTLY